MNLDGKPALRRLAESRNLSALLACAIIVGVSDWMLIGESLNYLRARSWVETSAIVTHQGILHDTKGGRSRWARYAYEWQGQRFSSERGHVVRFGHWRIDDPQPSIGAKVVCFVNSDNPAEACLLRSWPHLMTFLMALLNLGPAWLLLHAVRSNKSAS